MSEKQVWEYMNPNYILRAKGFAISYNPGDYLAPIFSGDGGSDETALLFRGKFYILNGDYRKRYEALIGKGYKACKQLFLDNIENRSSWSN
jgi:hypothetical protein